MFFPVKLIIHDLPLVFMAGIWSHDMILFVPWGWIPTAAMAVWVASMCNMPVLLGWYVPMIRAKSSSNVRDWSLGFVPRVCRSVKISETTLLKDWVFRPLSKKRRETLMFFVPNNSWIGDGNSNIVDEFSPFYLGRKIYPIWLARIVVQTAGSKPTTN